MPTLIRLVIFLAVLAGLAFGGMFALVAAVTPREKDVTIRIPARELVPGPDRAPIVKREIDTTRPATTSPAPADPAPADVPPAAPADGNAGGDEVVTVEQGVE